MSFACAQKTQLLIAVCTFIILSTKAAGIYRDMCPVQKQTPHTPVCALLGFQVSWVSAAPLPCALGGAGGGCQWQPPEPPMELGPGCTAGTALQAVQGPSEPATAPLPAPQG